MKHHRFRAACACKKCCRTRKRTLARLDARWKREKFALHPKATLWRPQA